MTYFRSFAATQYQRFFCFMLMLGMSGWTLNLQGETPRQITIDGKFEDWNKIKSHTDPADDTHDTDGFFKDYQPEHVKHPDVDLLEYKFAHDSQSLYAYFRARGVIGRTQKEDKDDEKRAGRYYATITVDVDNDDETGYWLHEGGYFPTSRGYDVNGEIEWYNGEFNAGQYLNHCCLNRRELWQALFDQSAGQFVHRNRGPYPAGFMRLGPGSYRRYTQWSYHKDDTITFTRDKGPVVPGIITVKSSEDGHEIEMGIPMKGFLVDSEGDPIIRLNRTIDISFSLEASGELSPDDEPGWASDTGDPIVGYLLEPAAKP